MNQRGNETGNFCEVQQFRQTWVWVLVLPISLFFTILFGYGMIKQLIFGHPWGGRPLSDRFFPLTHQNITFEDITRCEVRTYNPIREFGGWGIRYRRGAKAYNVSGNRGVQLELANGKRLLIGSQRSEELARAIEAKMKR
jgi:hypothetical protein